MRRPRPQPLLGFLPERKGQGRVSNLGLASLNNVAGSGLQQWSLAVWFLTLSDVGQGKHWLGVGELEKEVVGAVDSGLADLYAEGHFQAGCYCL